MIEVAAFPSIAASRNDGDYRRVFHVFVTTYRVRHEQRTFLLGNKWPRAPFSVSFSLITPRINRWILNDSRGYKEKACQGLFRDHSSCNFREEHTKNRDRLQLRGISEDSTDIENTMRNVQTYNRDFKSPDLLLELFFTLSVFVS